MLRVRFRTMRELLWIATAGLLVLLMMSAGEHTGANGADTPVSTISKLQSLDPLIRQAAFDTLVNDRKDAIAKVLTILKQEDIDKAFNGPLHRSIELLGHWRASEAVPALTGILLYIPNGFITDEMIPREAYYVSAVALVHIGEPSIGAMVERIRSSKSKSERQLAAWVIREIEGKEQAQYRLARLSQQDRIAAEQYQDAELFVRTYVPKFEPPQ